MAKVPEQENTGVGRGLFSSKRDRGTLNWRKKGETARGSHVVGAWGKRRVRD